MNDSIQEFWVTESGEWGSNEVETVTFKGHHDDIHEAFDMVLDHRLPEWAVYLSRHPHEINRNTYNACQTCEDLAEVFDL